MDDTKLNEVIKFLQIIQPIRVIEWKEIQIEQDLGEGSYGAVKKVKIPNSSKPLAMKILKLVQCRNKEETELQYERIHREIQLLQSCSHPNILPLYGISINYEKTPFEIGILTPLEWGSLAKLLDLIYKGQASEENLPGKKSITNEIKQKIIFGISAGLLYLSTKNIIHRDIKPENILLDENLNPLLSDFGFAKELIIKGWDHEPWKRPTAREIVEILMKKEALLPQVDERKMKEYEREVLKNIPDFLITIIEKLEKLEGEFEKQNILIENIQKQLRQFEENLQKDKKRHHKKQQENEKPKSGKKVLNFKIAEAKDLPKGFYRRDPFCEYQYGKQKGKTETFENTLTPQWNYTGKVEIKDSEDKITFKVKDYDFDGPNDDLGSIEFKISAFIHGQVTDRWYPLTLKDKQTGQIHLVLHLANENDTPFEEKKEEKLNVSISQTEINDFESKYQRESKYDSKFTMLHFAAKINDSKMGILLISKGADINANDIIYLIKKYYFSLTEF